MCSQWYSLLKQFIKKRFLGLFAFFITFIVVIIIFCVIIHGKYSKERIIKQMIPKDAHIILEQKNDIYSDVIHLFFIDCDGSYGILTLKNTISGYKTIDFDDNLIIHATDENYSALSNFHYSGFRINRKDYYICWGILIDSHISMVSHDNLKYNILPNPFANNRICYIMRKGSLPDFPQLYFY